MQQALYNNVAINTAARPAAAPKAARPSLARTSPGAGTCTASSP